MLTGVKDIDIQILNILDDRDLGNACRTYRAARNICNDQQFWFNRILSRFPEIPVEVLYRYRGSRSWSDYYIEDLITQGPDTLSKASSQGRLDQVVISIQRGANVHVLNSNYNTRIFG